MLSPLSIEGARALGAACAINHVRIAASAAGFIVEINRQFIFATRDKEARYFSRSDTCLSWLREIGVKKIDEVDLSDWAVADKAEKTMPPTKRNNKQPRRGTSKVAKK